VIAGHLVRARVFALEFVINAFEGVTLSRAADEKTGLFLWK
jgi:predicted DNA-binding protein with PD1-like motif